MKPSIAFVVSVARGLVISGALILLLPAIISADSLWYVMPITELVVMFYVVAMMKKETATLPTKG